MSSTQAQSQRSFKIKTLAKRKRKINAKIAELEKFSLGVSSEPISERVTEADPNCFDSEYPKFPVKSASKQVDN